MVLWLVVGGVVVAVYRVVVAVVAVIVVFVVLVLVPLLVLVLGLVLVLVLALALALALARALAFPPAFATSGNLQRSRSLYLPRVFCRSTYLVCSFDETKLISWLPPPTQQLATSREYQPTLSPTGYPVYFSIILSLW